MKTKKAIDSNQGMVAMLVISSLAVFIIISLGTIFLRQDTKEVSVVGDKNNHVYKSCYAMIVGNTEDLFWQSVYKAAKAEGDSQDILVELIGEGLLKEYTILDKFKIALASKVDGIMFVSDGEDMEEILDEAAKVDIPVITLLNDCIKGERTSFIGVNNSDIAKLYIEAIGKVEEPVNNIMILIDAQDKLNSSNMMCLSISEALSVRGFNVEVRPIDRTNTFSAEEIIRNIILDQTRIPDVLICLNTEDTLCAYQAVIDYNKVGQVIIMGYYQSDAILEGIDKGIISTSLFIDTNQMGVQGVKALSDYRINDQVNAYFTVGVGLIDQENVSEYTKKKGE